MITLLQKAKKSPRVKNRYHNIYDEEDLDLVLAYLNREVCLVQVADAIGRKRNSGSVLYYVAAVIKEFFIRGKVKITKI